MTMFYVDAPAPGAHLLPSDGNSPSAPLHGLDKVAELRLNAGDIVALRAGTVFELAGGKGSFVIAATGSAAAPINFTRYGAGANPLIKAGGKVGIDVAGSFVKLACIDVAGGELAGVRVRATAHNATFENMNVSGAGFGFEVLGTHSLFSHNAVHDLRMIVNTPGGDDDFGAVAFAIQGSENEFSFNRVWNAKAPSFDYGTDGGGFEFWKSVKGIRIHHNWVEDSAGFLEVGGEGPKDVLDAVEVFGNVSYRNDVFQWIHNAPSEGKYGMDVAGLFVHHNTIIEPSATQVIGFDGPVKPGSFVFTRNLVFAPAAQVFNQPGDFHFENFYEVGSRPGGREEVVGTAKFVDESIRNFQTKTGSAAAGYGAYSLEQGPSDAGPSDCASNK